MRLLHISVFGKLGQDKLLPLRQRQCPIRECGKQHRCPCLAAARDLLNQGSVLQCRATQLDEAFHVALLDLCAEVGRMLQAGFL